MDRLALVQHPIATGPCPEDRAARARDVLRLVAAGFFGAGAVVLLLAPLAPDPDPSDHRGLVLLGAAFALAALGLVLVRRPPLALLVALPGLGTVGVSAAVAIAEPISVTPSFYLLPVVAAAYFFGRRLFAAHLAFTASASALSLALWAEPPLRTVAFADTLLIVVLVSVLVAALKERLATLVHELRHASTTDTLTGLLSRGGLVPRAEAGLARAGRSERPLSLLLLDLDGLKALNDSFGHAAGDVALQRLASDLRAVIRHDDWAGRLGGDEFVVVLPDSDLEDALEVAERVRERAARHAPRATVSVGAAQWAPDETLPELLRRADAALYAAKQGGRDAVMTAAAA